MIKLFKLKDKKTIELLGSTEVTEMELMQLAVSDMLRSNCDFLTTVEDILEKESYQEFLEKQDSIIKNFENLLFFRNLT